MIFIDPANKNLAGTGKVNKKSSGTRKEKFLAKIKSREATNSSQAEKIADLQSMLFLQEIDDKNISDRQNLKKFGIGAINILKTLQLALLKENLTLQHLEKMREIAKKMPQLQDPDLIEIASEIVLKIEVEIAKLEMNIQ